ncbi:MAG: hypothetical protein O9310_02785 [Leptospiraceae bacterium]|nr:hypothetical protein [Leptospiraceae bacterium]
MESRIINLVGLLSAESGSQLYLELKSLLSSPHLVLFDASRLEMIDEIGWQFLKKCQTKILDSESFAAINGLNQEFISGWMRNNLLTSIPNFDDRDSAKRYLASKIESRLEVQAKIPPRPHPSFNASLYCPHCDSILRTYQMGNNTCPSCKGKYFLHKDYKISSFEKVL